MKIFYMFKKSRCNMTKFISLLSLFYHGVSNYWKFITLCNQNCAADFMSEIN